MKDKNCPRVQSLLSLLKLLEASCQIIKVYISSGFRASTVLWEGGVWDRREVQVVCRESGWLHPRLWTSWLQASGEKFSSNLVLFFRTEQHIALNLHLWSTVINANQTRMRISYKDSHRGGLD